jgi:hypothetical protein
MMTMTMSDQNELRERLEAEGFGFLLSTEGQEIISRGF